MNQGGKYEIVEDDNLFKKRRPVRDESEESDESGFDDSDYQMTLQIQNELRRSR